ncbi:MAG: hypothetical protein KC656_24405, partial [Myxococcales bacterium]|nr:hypothetical protein [Myxococcales bacterium]
VPVLAARPVGRVSRVPECTGEAVPCVLALGDVSRPAGEVRAWPLCVGDQPTLGHLAARLLGPVRDPVSFRRDGWCADPVPLRLPPADPCAAPWKRLWVSELVDGERYEGRDPLTHEGPASCGSTVADLAGRVVFVGDGRMASSGRDVVRLGDAAGGEARTFAGPEVHAVVTWNLMPLLVP